MDTSSINWAIVSPSPLSDRVIYASRPVQDNNGLVRIVMEYQMISGRAYVPAFTQHSCTEANRMQIWDQLKPGKKLESLQTELHPKWNT